MARIVLVRVLLYCSQQPIFDKQVGLVGYHRLSCEMHTIDGTRWTLLLYIFFLLSIYVPLKGPHLLLLHYNIYTLAAKDHCPPQPQY